MVESFLLQLLLEFLDGLNLLGLVVYFIVDPPPAILASTQEQFFLCISTQLQGMMI